MSPLVAVILITVTIESKGAAVKPVVSFNPNWGTVLAYESVTLTCNVAPPAQREQKYHWYRNNRNLTINDQSFTVNYAEEKDIGDYQCRAGNGDISEAVRLEVSGAHVILQVPPLVFEGDILSLRCHSYDKFPAVETTFYKDHKEIKSLGTASELLVGKVNMETSGLYKCSRRIKSHSSFHNYSDQVDIVVQEMFSLPQIKVRPDQVSEGDNMTITCDTKLSPHRETTELQFAFYRNGHNVQGFSLSNQYGVPSAQLEDSGNYTCEVQTPTGSVRKRSNMAHIQIQASQIQQSSVPLPVLVEGQPEFEIQEFLDSRLVRERSYAPIGIGVTLALLILVIIVALLVYEFRNRVVSSFLNRHNSSIRSELFSKPVAKVTESHSKQGKVLTVTCDTKLSPRKETIELQFAFYRNGRNVQFSLSNQYGVPSGQLEDSGNYTCEVQTPTGSVRKRSNILHIQIQG